LASHVLCLIFLIWLFTVHPLRNCPKVWHQPQAVIGK
jgi:hypothetical protein